MPKITRNEDGEYEMPLPDGRTLVSSHPEELERMAAATVDAQEHNRVFLERWKEGVKLAGTRFFDIKADSVEAATDKNQLRPSESLGEQASAELTDGERLFLYALCSFFNHEWAAELSGREAETGNVGELAQHLDQERVQVIADLLVSYRGW